MNGVKTQHFCDLVEQKLYGRHGTFSVSFLLSRMSMEDRTFSMGLLLNRLSMEETTFFMALVEQNVYGRERQFFMGLLLNRKSMEKTANLLWISCSTESL